MSDCSTHAYDVLLKPCPFCGGEAELVCNDIGVFVGCFHENCPIGPQTSTYFDGYATEAEAVAAWNSRAERTCECVAEYAKSPLDGKTIVLHRCSACNELMRPHMNYCPNCGARRVGE